MVILALIATLAILQINIYIHKMHFFLEDKILKTLVSIFLTEWLCDRTLEGGRYGRSCELVFNFPIMPQKSLIISHSFAGVVE